MREAHLPWVVDIERSAYTFPWTEGLFRDCLRVGYSAWVVTDTVNDVLVAHGLEANYKAGKSEISLRLAGDRSKKLRTRILINQGGILHTPRGTAIRVVPRYTHLGGVEAANCNMTPEIENRGKGHRKAVGALKKAVFGKRISSLSTSFSMLKRWPTPNSYTTATLGRN